MSGPKTVYVVTRGEYSSYGIEAVFDDAALAERYVELKNRGRTYDQCEIEPWPVNEHRGWVERGLLRWRVVFDEAGDVYQADVPEWTVWEGEGVRLFAEKFYLRSPDGRKPAVVCTTEQPDREAAVKVCAERRADFLATQEGISLATGEPQGDGWTWALAWNETPFVKTIRRPGRAVGTGTTWGWGAPPEDCGE